MLSTKTALAQQLKVVAQTVVASNWQLPTDGTWNWVRSSESAKVARIVIENEEFYFKAFLARGTIESVKTFFRGSRARRFWDQSSLLDDNGFFVPLVITAEVNGTIPWVIMESVRGIAWGDYLCSFLTNPKTTARLNWKRKLIRALGTEIGRLHKQGFVHGDLNPFNVLLEANEKEIKFKLIDNERSRRLLYFFDRERVRNLVQINFFRSPHMQRTDLLRFWKSYSEAAELSKSKQNRVRIRAYNNLHERLVARSGDMIFGNSGINEELLSYIPG